MRLWPVHKTGDGQDNGATQQLILYGLEKRSCILDLILNNLRIPVEKDGIDDYIITASQNLNISKDGIKFIKILSKSLDARGKKQFYYEISIVVSVPDSFANKDNLPVYTNKINKRIGK